MTVDIQALKEELKRQKSNALEQQRRIRLKLAEGTIDFALLVNSWVSTLDGKFEYRHNLRYEDDVILVVEIHLPRGCYLPFHKHNLDGFSSEIMLVLNEAKCYYSYTGKERVPLLKGLPAVIDAKKLHSLEAAPGARLYIIWTKI